MCRIIEKKKCRWISRITKKIVLLGEKLDVTPKDRNEKTREKMG